MSSAHYRAASDTAHARCLRGRRRPAGYVYVASVAVKLMTTATNLCRYPPPARGRSRYVRNALRGRCRRSRGESRARSFLRSADGPSFALLQACSCACAVTSPLFFFLFSAHICFSLPPPARLSPLASLLFFYPSLRRRHILCASVLRDCFLLFSVRVRWRSGALRHPSGAFGQVKFCGPSDSATTRFAQHREMAQRPKPRLR